MLPYETLLEHILKTFLASETDARTVLNEVRPVKRVALVVYASNSSLCGGFNANVIRLLQHVVDEYAELGKENIVIYPIGRKVAEKAVKMGLNVAGDFTALAEKPNANDCITIARELGEKFIGGEYDRVEMIYHHFKSAGSQILTRKPFLPIDIEEELKRDHERDLTSNVITKKVQEYIKRKEEERKSEHKEAVPLNDKFLVEPDMNTVLTKLIPKYLHLMVYTALLDSIASEHAARMVAMQTATDNAAPVTKSAIAPSKEQCEYNDDPKPATIAAPAVASISVDIRYKRNRRAISCVEHIRYLQKYFIHKDLLDLDRPVSFYI
jgi:F-type H+-transporting ATPase subunit gamma